MSRGATKALIQEALQHTIEHALAVLSLHQLVKGKVVREQVPRLLVHDCNLLGSLLHNRDGDAWGEEPLTAWQGVRLWQLPVFSAVERWCLPAVVS